MMFPVISNIRDVWHHIEGRKDFVHAVKDGYQVIDYLFVDKDTFDNPYRLECRGLKFDAITGALIARPFHKFFNVGEKYATDIDWSRPHIIMDKLDGSMIHACLVDGKVRFMTRFGITEHALRAEAAHLTDELKEAMLGDLMAGATPIFEWTAPENRIVLSYPESKLTLLAIRWNDDGEYVSRMQLVCVAGEWGVPLVKTIGIPKLFDSLYEEIGIEGYVAWFTDTDEFYKIKTHEYVARHRALSFFERENMILPIVLDGGVDDLIPSLSDEDRQRLLDYQSAVMRQVTELAETLDMIVGSAIISGMDRKTFALQIVAQAHPRLKTAYFRIMDGDNPLDTVKKIVLKYPELLKTRWN